MFYRKYDVQGEDLYTENPPPTKWYQKTVSLKVLITLVCVFSIVAFALGNAVALLSSGNTEKTAIEQKKSGTTTGKNGTTQVNEKSGGTTTKKSGSESTIQENSAKTTVEETGSGAPTTLRENVECETTTQENTSPITTQENRGLATTKGKPGKTNNMVFLLPVLEAVY